MNFCPPNPVEKENKSENAQNAIPQRMHQESSTWFNCHNQNHISHRNEFFDNLHVCSGFQR